MNIEEVLDLRLEVQRFIRLFGLLEQTVTPCGFPLSISQVYALQELEKGVLSASELAQKLNLERSSVSRLVDVLVSGDFVKRELNVDNRREVKIFLTEKGERTLQQIRQQSVVFYQSILQNLTEEDQKKILDSFKIFTACLSTRNGVE